MATISEGLIGRLGLDIRPWLTALKKAQNASDRFAEEVERDSKKITNAHRSMWAKVVSAARVAGTKIRAVMGRVRAAVNRVRAAVSGIRGAMIGLAATLGLALGGAAIASEARKMSQAGQDFEETFAKFEAVFKDFTEDSLKWANAFAEQVGRGKVEVYEWMARLQDTFVPLGFARQEAARLSSQIVRLGVDLASFNNMADQDVIENLTSAIVGQHIAVRKYGIVLNEASLNQELFNMGVMGGVRAATNLQKVQARLRVIMKSSTDAQGDAVRTAASFANQMKRLNSELADVRAELGMELNKAILEVVQEMGGASKVAEKLRAVFKFVVEVAKLFVLWMGSAGESLSKWTHEAGGAEAAALSVAAKVKRIGVGIQSVWHLFTLMGQGLRVLFDGVIIALKTVWTLIKSVGKALAGGVLKAIAKIGLAIADVVTALAYLGDLVGLTDDAATKVDLVRGNIEALDKAADDMFDSMSEGWDDVAKTAEAARRRWIQFAKTQEEQRTAIKEMSGQIANLERKAAEAQERYAKASKARRKAEVQGAEDVLKVRLTAEQKAAAEAMSTLRESLTAKVQEIEATEERIQKSYKETKDAFTTAMREMENAYKEHTRRLSQIDQERAKFNQTMEERIFRLRIKNLSPEEQAASLMTAMREMQFRARQALSAGNYGGARDFMEKAASFAEEVADLQPNMADEMAARMQEMARSVNDIFRYEEAYHSRAAREALDRKKDLAQKLEELETQQKAWSESFQRLIKQWAMLNQQSKEDLDRFSKELEELTKPRQVLIDAITGPALAKIQEVQEALNRLRSAPVVIDTPRLPLETPTPVQGAGDAPINKAFGGWVPGVGTRDSVPAMLAPGEFVVRREVAAQFPGLLEAMNRGAGGQTVNVGDVNVTVTGSGSAEQDAVAIGKALRREIRRGRVTLD